MGINQTVKKSVKKFTESTDKVTNEIKEMRKEAHHTAEITQAESEGWRAEAHHATDTTQAESEGWRAHHATDATQAESAGWRAEAHYATDATKDESAEWRAEAHYATDATQAESTEWREEVAEWRKDLEKTGHSVKEVAHSAGDTIGKSAHAAQSCLVSAFIASTIGNTAEAVAEKMGCSLTTQARVKYASSAVLGTVVSTAVKATKFTPQAIGVRIALNLTTPLLHTALEWAGCSENGASALIGITQFAVKCAANPVSAVPEALGAIAGNAVGHRVGTKVTRAVIGFFRRPEEQVQPLAQQAQAQPPLQPQFQIDPVPQQGRLLYA